ncbi:MAG: hypothetical protein JNL28_06625 [Planctomycetes bacterium]|nr:hypothetical protein [Planctomycetota bacterium]
MLLLLGAVGCSAWRTVEVRDGWTLYGEKGQAVDAAAFRASFDPGYRAVERVFGPFSENVRVHAITSDKSAVEASMRDVRTIQEVPGIGRARVQAYHARGDGVFGPMTGIYADAPEPGTAVHELVHARIAEIAADLPLWLEEGLACFLGDGFLDGDEWIVDGYACWPVRELREQRLPDKELVRVLKLAAADEASVRENVLVHFIGWAIVFDLRQEAGTLDWKQWFARYKKGISVDEARLRIERTVSRDTEAAWLERLKSPDRRTRLATAKGLWKLRSRAAVESLLDAIDREDDAEVKVALAVNALAAGGDVKLTDDARDRFWPTVWPALRRGHLNDPAEQEALRGLYSSYRRRTQMSSQQALEGLRRYWAEE